MKDRKYRTRYRGRPAMGKATFVKEAAKEWLKVQLGKL